MTRKHTRRRRPPSGSGPAGRSRLVMGGVAALAVAVGFWVLEPLGFQHNEVAVAIDRRYHADVFAIGGQLQAGKFSVLEKLLNRDPAGIRERSLGEEEQENGEDNSGWYAHYHGPFQ